MLDQSMLANILISISALLGLWIFFHWPYANYRRDLLQSRLFTLRQELFDYARHGDISFQHPAYGVLRTTINGFIKVGPQLNLIGIGFLLCILRSEDFDHREGYTERLDRLSADLPGDVSDKLRLIRFRLNFYILSHVVFTSLLTALVFLPGSAVLRCVDGIRLLKPRTTHLRLDRVDTAALAIGSGSTVLNSGYQLPGSWATARRAS